MFWFPPSRWPGVRFNLCLLFAVSPPFASLQGAPNIAHSCTVGRGLHPTWACFGSRTSGRSLLTLELSASCRQRSLCLPTLTNPFSKYSPSSPSPQGCHFLSLLPHLKERGLIKSTLFAGRGRLCSDMRSQCLGGWYLSILVVIPLSPEQ